MIMIIEVKNGKVVRGEAQHKNGVDLNELGLSTRVFNDLITKMIKKASIQLSESITKLRDSSISDDGIKSVPVDS